jgi:hypothetical protein
MIIIHGEDGEDGGGGTYGGGKAGKGGGITFTCPNCGEPVRVEISHEFWSGGSGGSVGNPPRQKPSRRWWRFWE